MTEVIKPNDPESCKYAASILKSGGVIIYPTETLYGIGALATNERSVKSIFEIKGRPYGKPFPLLVKDKNMLADTAELNQTASLLVDAFLPGALTLILKDKSNLPKLTASDAGKIAVRISNHLFVRGLFEHISDPIVSTSANASGGDNLLDFEEIYRLFNGKVDLIVNSDKISPSKGSTIVDVTVIPPVIIRKGDISREKIEKKIKGFI